MNENLSSVEFLRTNSTHPDFRRLITALDEDLYLRNGEGQLIYRQYNQVVHIHAHWECA